MYQICKHDPERDFPFEPGLAVDLAEVISKGIVPATGTAVDYNDIQDVNSIVGSARDVFEVMDAERKYRNRASTEAAPISGSQPSEGAPSE